MHTIATISGWCGTQPSAHRCSVFFSNIIIYISACVNLQCKATKRQIKHIFTVAANIKTWISCLIQSKNEKSSQFESDSGMMMFSFNLCKAKKVKFMYIKTQTA